MHKEVFIVSVGIAFLLQIIHSILTKGGRFTLEFFGGGFLFGFVRELIYISFIQNYEFPNMAIKLINVPIFIPIGWVFTFYLAYEFTNKLMEPKTVKDYKDFIIFTAFFSTCICIPIETAAISMDWWKLIKWPINDNIAPHGLIGGWIYTSVVFFSIYFVVKKRLPREQLWFAVFLLLYVFVFEFRIIYHPHLIGFGLALLIIGFGGMLKYNKEITFILLGWFVIDICRSLTFPLLPNAIFVSISFIYIFICMLVKLRFRLKAIRVGVG
jgi:hypothetical protein